MSNFPPVYPSIPGNHPRNVFEEEEEEDDDDEVDDDDFDRDLFRAWRSYRLDLLSSDRKNTKRKSQRTSRVPSARQKTQNEYSSWDLPEDHEQESTGLFWISSSVRNKHSSTTNQRRRGPRHHATSPAARAAMNQQHQQHPDAISIATSSDNTPVISNAILSSFSTKRNSKSNNTSSNGSSAMEVSSYGYKEEEDDGISFLSTSSYSIYHYSSQPGGSLNRFLQRRRRILLIVLINMLLITLITTMSILAMRSKNHMKKSGSDPQKKPSPFNQNEDDDLFTGKKPQTGATLSPTIATSWNVLEKLTPKDNKEDLGYGNTVQLSSDGTVLAVTTITNSIYVYQDVDEASSAPRFSVERLILGSSTYMTEGTPAMALSRDGSILAISDPASDQKMGRIRIFLYETTNNSYELLGQDIVGSQPHMLLGTSLAVSESGRYIATGAQYSSETLRRQGQVLVHEYQESTNGWELLGAPLLGLRAASRFGSAVAIHHDDEEDSGTITLVASASSDKESAGYLNAYQWNKDDEAPAWALLGGKPIENPSQPKFVTDGFGITLSLQKISPSYFRLAAGVPGRIKDDAVIKDTGMVVVYEYNPTRNRQWTIVGRPIISQDPGIKFGQSVALLDDVVFVGAPGASQEAGLVRLLKFDSSTKSFLVSKAKTGFSPGDEFGISVSSARRGSDGRTIVVAGATARKSQSGPGYVLVLDV